MSTEPRLLVVDGYSRTGREDLAAGGATTAGELGLLITVNWPPTESVFM